MSFKRLFLLGLVFCLALCQILHVITTRAWEGILDWMLEDKVDTGIPHFIADNLSWLYPVDPKKINCAITGLCDSGSWGADTADETNATGLLSKLCFHD